MGNLEKSLEVLTKLVREEMMDKHFRGIKDLVDCLILWVDAHYTLMMLIMLYLYFIIYTHVSGNISFLSLSIWTI